MPPEASPPRLVPGQRIDQYEVIRPLGHGGMGEVWLCRDPVLGRRVALKLALPARLAAPGAAERFLREARAAARVSHPHVVAVYGTGTVGGAPYLAMEYLEGETLRARLARVRFAPREALLACRDLAAAIQAAHTAGLVHRDLKPDNVLLPADGRLRVVDFGLARAAEEEAPEAPATGERDPDGAASRRWGTAPYMAPEQWQGGPVGPAADIWAFGVMLFEMLAGERPFAGSGWQVGAQVCAGAPPPSVAARVPGVPAEVEDLVARCLAADPAMRPDSAALLAELSALTRMGGRAPQAAEACPYRGLLPFGPGHADLFFGRDREIAVFLEALHRQAVLPVVGPSGAGKSSFLLAGVLPAIQARGGWSTLVLRPGGEPLLALARRLVGAEGEPWSGALGGASSDGEAPPAAAADLARQLAERPAALGVLLRQRSRDEGGRLLLIVDQLEELFTLGADARERRAFADALLAAADDPDAPVRVAFTLREDFLGHLAEHAGLARSAVHGVTCLRAPDAQGLEEILVLPLEGTGLAYEEGLVREMVAAVVQEPAGLPLLQLCALRLWEERDRGRGLLTWRAYRALGGVGGALAALADGVLCALGEAEVRLARALLLRLCHPDGTRARVGRARLAEELGPGIEPVIDRFLDARLLSARRGTDEGVLLELSHEALALRWERLRRWREEARGDLTALAQARAAAETWEQRGHRRADLWRGESLLEAGRWAQRFDAGLPPLVERFLTASRREAARAGRRRRALFGGALGLAVLVAAGAVLAAVLIAGKEREARARMAQALLSDARSAFERQDYVEARAKLRTSLEAEDSAGGRALLASLAREPRTLRAATSGVNYAAAWAPDGRTLATAGSDDALRIWDTVTGAARIVRDAGSSYSLAWSPDGRLLAWGDSTGRLALLTTGTWTRAWRVQAHDTLVNAVAWSRDGTRLLSVGVGGDLRLADPRTGEALGTLAGLGGVPLSFGEDADTVRAPGAVWRLSTGERTATLRCPADDPRPALLDPSGTRLVGLNRAGLVPVCDAATGAVIDQIPTTGGDMWRSGQCQWSADGSRLLVENGEDGIILRDVLARRDLARWDYVPFASDLRADGQAVAFVDFDATVQVWRVPEGVEEGHGGHRDEIDNLAWSPDGTLLATASWDRSILLWDAATGRPTLLGRHDDAVRGVAWSPDGRSLASTSTDGSVRLWSVPARREALRLGGHGLYSYGAVFTPDGRFVASTGYDGNLRLWDAATGEQVRPPLLVGAHAHELAVCPGGEALAVTVGTRGEVLRVDLDRWTAEPAFTTGSSGLEALAFSPDGTRLAFLGTDFPLYVGEVATGRLLWQRLDAGTYQGDPIWLPGGARLAVGGWDGWLRTLGAQDGEMFAARGPFDGMLAAALSPDGRLLALAGNSSTVRFWDLAADRLRWRAPVLLDDPAGPLLVGSEGILRLQPDGTAAPTADLPDGLRAALSAADARARIAVATGDGRLLLQTWDQAVEAWDLAAGDRSWRQEVPWLGDAVPLPDGFASLAEGRVTVWRCVDGGCEGRPLSVAEVGCLAEAPGGFLIATPEAVWQHAADGTLVRQWPAQPGISALRLDGEVLLVGYENGPLEEVAPGGAPGGWAAPFEDTPGVTLLTLLPGPMGTLIGGYENGAVRIWSRTDHRRLLAEQLHGGVRHLLLRGETLFAATDTGDHIAIDLSAFHADRCAILRRAWAEIPVVWEDGVLERPGAGECGGHIRARSPSR